MANCPSCGALQSTPAPFCASCGKPMSGGPPPKTSTLAIVALVFALLPICPLVGMVLGVIALVRISNRPTELGGKGVAIAALVVPFAVYFVVGMLAAIAIPNFIRFQSRAKQAEVRANLRSIYTAEMAYEQEHGAPPKTFDEAGFSPEPHRRYAYFLGRDVRQPDVGGPYELPPQFQSAVAAPDILAAAVGNIDGDDTLDVWVITKSGDMRALQDDLTN